MKKLFFCYFIFTGICFGQQKKKSFLYPNKIGFLYNYGDEKNFLFDDKDYYYTTNVLKAQAFYNLGSWKSFDFELIAQPQVQFIRHQLLNVFYVQPNGNDNYLELRERYSKLKSMHLYGFELGFGVKKEIFNNLNAHFTLGLGVASIDTETERLAKGFTFIENFSLGLSHRIFKDTDIYLGTNFGHVSNLDFQLPNDGYNILGFEIGLQYSLQ